MKNMTKIAIGIVAIVIIVAAIVSYVYLSQPLTLSGAGATFPQPFLNAVVKKYTADVKTNLQINYQGVGSGQGISSLTNKVVDFAASDAPLTASQRQSAPNVLHIPETIGAVTLAYNLPSVQSGLNLTGDIIAKMYLGNITDWNDAQIQNLNPGITLPDHALITVHRADSSGTTRIFTKYLNNVTSSWGANLVGTSVPWPAAPGALGQNGNAAVASTVNTTQYAIGYVELAYALQNAMTVAAVKNPAGYYILPSLASTTTAVQSGASRGLPAGIEDWGNASLLNTPDAQAYPIVSFTYLLVYRELNVTSGMDKNKATQLVQFLWYVVHDGQLLAPALEYATLPPNVVAIDVTSIQSITYNGEHLPTS